MILNIRYLGLFRTKLKKKEEEIVIEDGSSLGVLIDELIKIHDDTLRELLAEERENILDPSFIITINGIPAAQLKGTHTKLNNRDKIALMNIVSGG
jgi:molybdopterin converting factor small subunit